MKWFHNMKIGTKIMLSFISMFLLILTVSYLGISNIVHISKNSEATYNENTVPLTNLIEIGITYQTTRVMLGEMILSKNKEEQDKSIEGLKELDIILHKNMGDFEKSITSENIHNEFNNLKNSLENYNSVREKVINMIQAGKNEEAISCIKENFTLARTVDDSIRKLSEMKTLEVKERYEEDAKLVSATIRHTGIVIIISIIKGLIVGYSVLKMSRKKI